LAVRGKTGLVVLLSVIALVGFVALGKNVSKRGSAGESQEATATTQEEKKENLPALLDFGRGECIPCKHMKPILEDVARLYRGKLEVKIIDIGDRPEMARRYRIRVIPTQVFFDAEGNEVYRHEGFLEKRKIIEKLSEMGVK